MQENLYFQPENYGSGKKKEHKEPKKKSEKKDHRVLKFLGFLLFLLIIILIILWLLRGKTTVSGQYPANVKNESLECISKELIYPKLGSFSPSPRENELVLTAVFSGEETLKSLSVKELMTFESNSDAIVAEARTHANFNIGLRPYNYSTGKFENKFSIMDNKLLVNLTAKASELDEFSKGYFLIASEELPSTLSEFRAEYENQGFSCRTDFNDLTNTSKE